MDYMDNSEERRKFEAVWKRVTERSNATISDYLNTGSDGIAQQGLPVPAELNFPADPSGNTPDLSFVSPGQKLQMPSPEADDARLLPGLIAEESGIICLYRRLVQRLKGGNCAGTLYRLYRECCENLRKLKAAYFLLTGETFKAAPSRTDGASLANALRSLYWLEANSAEDFYNASKTVRSDKLSSLLMKMSAAKKGRADELEALIGALLG